MPVSTSAVTASTRRESEHSYTGDVAAVPVVSVGMPGGVQCRRMSAPSSSVAFEKHGRACGCRVAWAQALAMRRGAGWCEPRLGDAAVAWPGGSTRSVFETTVGSRLPMPALPAQGLRRRLLRTLQTALGGSGLDGLWALRPGVRGATVLYFHSVPDDRVVPWIDPRNVIPPALFEAQMRFLATHRRVVSLQALVGGLERNGELAAGTVVLTFDDGYLDNLTTAAPILAQLGLPATFFLATGYVAAEEPQWVDRLHACYKARTSNRLDLQPLGARLFDLSDRRQVDVSYRFLCRRLLAATWTERQRTLAGVRDQLAPSVPPPRLTMGWDDVRHLLSLSEGFEVGVHTRHHVDLTERTPQDVQREIEGCVEDVARAVGARVRYFSYPYGRVDERARGAVAAAFEAAVATELGRPVREDADRFRIPRIEAPTNLRLLRFYTGGAYPGLSRFLVGRA